MAVPTATPNGRAPNASESARRYVPAVARAWALLLDDLPVEAVNENHDAAGWVLDDARRHPDRWPADALAPFAEVREATGRNLAARTVRPTPTRMRVDLGAIRQRIDLAGYVARCDPRVRYEERRNGERWTCRPFHQEKTASFCVYPDQHAHCYGCGWHGDLFFFHMKWFGVADFKRAIAELAWQAGLKPPRRGAVRGVIRGA